MPTVVEDQISGKVTAFVADCGQVSAVSLGSVSGSVPWTQFGLFGGQSIPTVVGSSIVLVGPNQYYAFDQVTGEENYFWTADSMAAEAATAAYDATRQQFYVLEYYNDPTPTLSAYHYTDNAHITLLWQRTGGRRWRWWFSGDRPKWQRLLGGGRGDLGVRSCHRGNASVLFPVHSQVG